MVSPDAHVYHINPVRLMVLPLVWLLFVGVLVVPAAISNEAKDWAAAVVVGGMLSAILLPIIAVTWQSRLVLTPDGIAHHQIGYTVRSAWTNVTELMLKPPCAGLVLKQPGVSSRMLRFSMSLFNDFGMGESFGGRLLEEGRFIQLQPFLWHWRRGPLREDVARWAPHLFRDGVSERRDP